MAKQLSESRIAIKVIEKLCLILLVFGLMVCVVFFVAKTGGEAISFIPVENDCLISAIGLSCVFFGILIVLLGIWAIKAILRDE